CLARKCEWLGMTVPSVSDIEQDLGDLIADVGNGRLYKRADETPSVTRAVGSEVLRELFWKWALAPYDKVADGVPLGKDVLKHDRELLEPFISVLAELRANVRRLRAN